MSLKYWLSSRRNITSVPTDFPNVHDKIVLFSSVWIKLSRSLKLNSQRFLFIFARNFRCALFSIFRSLRFCVWIFNLLHRRLSHFVIHKRFTYMLRLVCIFESVVDCRSWKVSVLKICFVDYVSLSMINCFSSLLSNNVNAIHLLSPCRWHCETDICYFLRWLWVAHCDGCYEPSKFRSQNYSD